MKWIFGILAVALLAVPQVMFAQEPIEGGLVTCSGTDCTFCDFVEMVSNLVTWLFSILVIAAVFMLVIAGFKLVTSGGNVSAMQGAKSMFTNVVIGFVIVLSAWLIVDTLMKALIQDKENFGMWNKLDTDSCGGQNYTDSLQNDGTIAPGSGVGNYSEGGYFIP